MKPLKQRVNIRAPANPAPPPLPFPPFSQPTSSNPQFPMKKTACILTTAILLAVAAILACFGYNRVDGNELAVVEKFYGGLQEKTIPSGGYIYNRILETYYNYSIADQVFVMNDTPRKRDFDREFGEGRANDAYLVQSKDQQNMRISLQVQWRRNPEKIVDLHKAAGSNVEERLLRPVLLRVVKDEATVRTALDAYSGDGLVALQKDVHTRLTDPTGELAQKGVIVSVFAIQGIVLDKEYTEQIVARQVAIQGQSRAKEETKWEDEKANKAKATAQADYETRLVQARRDKEAGILEAEKLAQTRVLSAKAEAEQVVLKAEAEKKRNIAEAEGKALAGELEGKGILAIGQATAESNKLLLTSFSAPGSENYVKTKIAESMGHAYSGIKGYVPEKMNITVLSENYAKGISLLLNSTAPAATETPAAPAIAPTPAAAKR
jgi:regulator of protease activity HflC (stomatin/prohibitin superfamily)